MAFVHTVALILWAASASSENPYFRIDVIDGETSRGVPLVQLKTSSYISYYTDSNGIVAFDEPGMLGLPVYFVVLSDGYTYANSWPGTPNSDPGILLETRAGGQATIVVNRTQHAERLYRMTGGGIYRDSVLVGQSSPIDSPLLDRAGVLGQDSLLAATYKGKAYWFFGDTECPAGPRSTDCQHYGRFTTGAVSCIPGVDSGCTVPPSLHYFMSKDSHAPGGMAADGKPSEKLLRLWNMNGFAHPKAMLAGPPDASGLRLYNQSTWVGSVAVIKEGTEERMYTTYVCPPNWPQGIAQWDDDQEQFVSILTAAWLPGIQWVMKTKPEDGDYIYYANPYVNARVPAKFASITNLSHYEFFSPCDPGVGAGLSNCSRHMNASSWRWQKSNIDGFSGVGIFGPDDEAAVIEKGFLSPQDARMQVKDTSTGSPIQHGLARGSVNWNAFRQKYVLIADKGMVDAGGENGESNYGELWYCESDSITGPWSACTKIITHEGTGTSCYNPLQLAFMDEQRGRVVYIACTWTSMWSGKRASPNDAACKFADYGGQGCAVAVPRYEYNNIVFRLDVANMEARSSTIVV